MILTLGFFKSIQRIQDGGRKFEQLSDYAKNLYNKIFCVADHEFDLWFSYFEKADSFQLLKS